MPAELPTRPRTGALLLALLLALVAACGGGGDEDAIDTESAATEAADYSFTIPAGAGEAYDRGEPLEIMPARLEAEVGEVIEIVNEDERGHLVGPFFVGEGETLRQRFSSKGEFVGECSVHPSGQIVVVVT